MTSPLPPRLRDTRSFVDRIRQDRTNLGQLGVGFMGGRFPPLRPLGSAALLGDIEDDQSEGETLVGEDGDRLTLTSVDTQTWQLSAQPVEETLVVRWHPDGAAGVEWKRGEHYALNDQTVTFTATALAAAGAQVGDVFSAQYLMVQGDDEVDEPESFTVPYSAEGWSYLILTGDRDTNTTDHSTDDFSAWPVGPMPIGKSGLGPYGGSGSSSVTLTTAEILWVARSVPATESMTIKVSVEDNGEVYVNGTLVLTIPEKGSGVWPEQTVVVDDPEVLNHGSENIVAMRVADETPISNAGCYVDIMITGTASL